MPLFKQDAKATPYNPAFVQMSVECLERRRRITYETRPLYGFCSLHVCWQSLCGRGGSGKPDFSHSENPIPTDRPVVPSGNTVISSIESHLSTGESHLSTGGAQIPPSRTFVPTGNSYVPHVECHHIGLDSPHCFLLVVGVE